MNRVLLVCLLMILFACEKEPLVKVGKYQFRVEGMKNITEGELDLVGETGDFFGRLILKGTRIRTYALGLTYGDKDTLDFQLPGGGYLRLGKTDQQWSGRFKYFGLEGNLTGQAVGPASKELQDLVALKPLGQGVISTSAEESFPCYDVDGESLYFTRENVLFESKYSEAQGWEVPDTVSFSGSFNDSAPKLLPSEDKMIFTSNRPVAGGDTGKKNLWLATKEDGQWKAPEILPFPINIDTLGDYHGGASSTGNYFFVSYNRSGGYGRSDLYVASLDSLGVPKVINMGDRINTENSEADVFIDPKERYLLFASTDREDSFGADDIYVSFREGEAWSTPQNLGKEVNSFAYDYGAWVDQKHGFLYFNSYRRGSSDIYRIPLDQLSLNLAVAESR